MTISELDVVVLRKDLPLHGLRAEDVGTVVLVHAPGAFEIEFADGDGVAHAIVTLTADDVRPR